MGSLRPAGYREILARREPPTRRPYSSVGFAPLFRILEGAGGEGVGRDGTCRTAERIKGRPAESGCVNLGCTGASKNSIRRIASIRCSICSRSRQRSLRKKPAGSPAEPFVIPQALATAPTAEKLVRWKGPFLNDAQDACGCNCLGSKFAPFFPIFANHQSQEWYAETIAHSNIYRDRQLSGPTAAENKVREKAGVVVPKQRSEGFLARS